MFHFSLGNGEGNNEGSGFHNARVYALDMANLNDVTTTDLPADQFYTMYPAVMHGAQPGTPMEFVVSSGVKDVTVGRLTNTDQGPMSEPECRSALSRRPLSLGSCPLPLGPQLSSLIPQPSSLPPPLTAPLPPAAWRGRR